MAVEEIRQAPFNMALNTLESIRDWIDNIAKLSIGIYGGERIDSNEMIVIKHRMVKQLIMLSTPLLEPKFLEEIEIFFSTIKSPSSCTQSNSKSLLSNIQKTSVPVPVVNALNV